MDSLTESVWKIDAELAGLDRGINTMEIMNEMAEGGEGGKEKVDDHHSG